MCAGYTDVTLAQWSLSFLIVAASTVRMPIIYSFLSSYRLTQCSLPLSTCKPPYSLRVSDKVLCQNCSDNDFVAQDTGSVRTYEEPTAYQEQGDWQITIDSMIMSSLHSIPCHNQVIAALPISTSFYKAADIRRVGEMHVDRSNSCILIMRFD